MDTRTKILESVIKEAKNSSIGKISTISVSKLANTSEANIYRIFKTKDNLLIEAFLYIDAKAAKQFSTDYNETDFSSPDRLVNLIYHEWRKYFDFFVKNYAYVRYYSQFRMDKLYSTAVKEKRTENYHKIASLLDHIRQYITSYSGINYEFFFLLMQDMTLMVCQRIASKDIENTEENILYAFHLIFDSVLNF